MPKVFLTQRQKDAERLKRAIRKMQVGADVSQQRLADMLGLSQQTLSYRIGHGALLATDLLAILRHLRPDARELEELLGRR